MKPFAYIAIWILLLVGIQACQRYTDYPRTMQQAETLMDTRPDSALSLLQSMADSLAMLPDETQMYHHLLTIQAKDKQYITHTSDSLINRIVSFYEDYGDNERLMMAYFYQGSTYRDMNDAPRALKAFHQAIDAGKDTKNLTLLGQTYGQMGSLFSYQELYNEALEAHKKSLTIYGKLKKNNKTPLVARNIARIYDAKEENDSAIYYYNQALQLSKHINNPNIVNNINSELGCLYFKLGEKHKAKTTLRALKEKPSKKTNALLYLGILYKEEHQNDSARYFFNQVIKYGDLNKRCAAHKYLSQIELEDGNSNKAKTHIKFQQILHDSIKILTQTEKVGNVHLTQNYKRVQKENKALKQERDTFRNHLLIISIIILVVICCIILNKRQKSNSIETKLSNIAHTEIYRLFHKASRNEFTISEQHWEQLQEILETHIPEFCKQLSKKKVIFKMSLHEVRICYLTKLGFTNRKIAIITCVTESAISHTKNRLYKKIKGEKGTSSKFLDSIEEL